VEGDVEPKLRVPFDVKGAKKAQNELRLVKESIPYILVPAVLAVVAAALGYWYVSAVLFIVALFMAFFFRHPRRVPPSDPDVVVSPADGRVTRIEPQSPGTVISIFLSPLDVHINRSPIPGKIVDMVYSRGKFLIATNEQASLVNEQNALTIEGEKITVVCKQIAGILARRIVVWKRAGDYLGLGEPFGMIKFSSRTDILLPANVRVTVKEGDRVRGGITVIGRIS
jgi:phosphatidylserine decarboxylase